MGRVLGHRADGRVVELQCQVFGGDLGVIEEVLGPLRAGMRDVVLVEERCPVREGLTADAVADRLDNAVVVLGLVPFLGAEVQCFDLGADVEGVDRALLEGGHQATEVDVLAISAFVEAVEGRLAKGAATDEVGVIDQRPLRRARRSGHKGEGAAHQGDHDVLTAAGPFALVEGGADALDGQQAGAEAGDRCDDEGRAGTPACLVVDAVAGRDEAVIHRLVDLWTIVAVAGNSAGNQPWVFCCQGWVIPGQRRSAIEGGLCEEYVRARYEAPDHVKTLG
jgi:hypothetical protein